MNLAEGTRRLALLLGVVGAIAGGFVSYLELQELLNQRARHNRFEQLALSAAVQQERKILRAWTPVDISAGLGPKSTRDAKPTVDYDALATEAKGKTLQPSPSAAVHATEWDADGNSIPANRQQGYRDPRTGERVQSPDPYAAYGGHALDLSKSVPLPSEFRDGAIRTVNWGHDYVVSSIETDDGQTLYPTTAPSVWNYLLIGLLPVLGFVIPWSVVRSVGWVGSGFVAKAP